MPVVKKRNQQTESRLLLESDEPVELPPAEIDEKSIILQFETFKPHLPELLEALRAGTMAEPVPVMMDGSTFVIHGETRSFWVKLWHSSPERTQIERAQVISCLPSTRGMQVLFDDPEDYADEDEEYDDDDFDDDEDEAFVESSGSNSAGSAHADGSEDAPEEADDSELPPR